MKQEGFKYAERICIRENISGFRCSKVIENTESSAQDRLPFLGPSKLIRYAESRRHVAVPRSIRRGPNWCQSQVRQVVQIKTGHCIETWAVCRLGHEIDIPSQTIRNREARDDPPS